MLEGCLAAGVHVFCETPWDGGTAMHELVTARARVSCIGAPLRSPYARAWKAVSALAQQGRLGQPRWSHAYMAPVATAEASAWRRQFAEAVFPLLAAHPDTQAKTVTTLAGRSTGHTKPEFLTEVRFDSGNTLLVQGTRANPAGLRPVLRGSRASLELRGGEMLLCPEDGGCVETVCVPRDATALGDWLERVRLSAPDAPFADVMMASETLAAHAWASLERGETVRV
jgi:hypothetical protein